MPHFISPVQCDCWKHLNLYSFTVLGLLMNWWVPEEIVGNSAEPTYLIFPFLRYFLYSILVVLEALDFWISSLALRKGEKFCSDFPSLTIYSIQILRSLPWLRNGYICLVVKSGIWYQALLSEFLFSQDPDPSITSSLASSSVPSNRWMFFCCCLLVWLISRFPSF